MPSCPWRSFDELLIYSPADELLIGGDEQLIKKPGQGCTGRGQGSFCDALRGLAGPPPPRAGCDPLEIHFQPDFVPLESLDAPQVHT